MGPDEKLLCSVKLERASRPRSITPALGAIVETMAARGMLSKGATENCVTDVFYPRKGFGLMPLSTSAARVSPISASPSSTSRRPEGALVSTLSVGCFTSGLRLVLCAILIVAA